MRGLRHAPPCCKTTVSGYFSHKEVVLSVISKERWPTTPTGRVWRFGSSVAVRNGAVEKIQKLALRSTPAAIAMADPDIALAIELTVHVRLARIRGCHNNKTGHHKERAGQAHRWCKEQSLTNWWIVATVAAVVKTEPKRLNLKKNSKRSTLSG